MSRQENKNIKGLKSSRYGRRQVPGVNERTKLKVKVKIVLDRLDITDLVVMQMQQGRVGRVQDSTTLN